MLLDFDCKIKYNIVYKQEKVCRNFAIGIGNFAKNIGNFAIAKFPIL